MDLWVICLTVLIGALCIYFLSIRNFDYFKKLGIPHAKPTPLFGNMGDMILKSTGFQNVVQVAYDCHPDAKYVGFYDFSTPIIVVKDPELVKSIAIKNFDSFPNHKLFINSPTEPLFQKNLFALQDDTWREMRALLSPAFTSSKMKMMFKILSQCAVNFSDHLATMKSRPEEFDVKDTFGRYTLDVIATIAFGLTVNSMKDRDNKFYRLGRAISDFSLLVMVKFFIVRSCPWIAKVFNIRFLDLETSNFFTDVIKTTIETRDAQGIVRPDMIQLMMQARDKKEKSDLSIEDMTAQAFIFLLGGFESPSLTMSFATLALALNPEVQKRLQDEIDEVLEKSPGEVSYEDLHEMKYLDAVISETLRMFPPGILSDRVGPKSFTLPPALPGLEPLTIKPGQSIWIPTFSYHYDPQYFPDPEKFDPERFNEDNRSQINPLTYLPFGIGPRICIANRFALMEVKLALFYLLAKCSLSPSPKTSSLKLDPKRFNLMPVGGFWVKIEPRK